MWWHFQCSTGAVNTLYSKWNRSKVCHTHALSELHKPSSYSVKEHNYGANIKKQSLNSIQLSKGFSAQMHAMSIYQWIHSHSHMKLCLSFWSLSLIALIDVDVDVGYWFHIANYREHSCSLYVPSRVTFYFRLIIELNSSFFRSVSFHNC